MPTSINYTRGDTIGILTYIAPFENIGNKRQGIFLCRCGTEFVTRIDRAKDVRVASCGCATKEIRSDKLKTHGLSKSPLYNVWNLMIARCHNPNKDNYHEYGGRGVVVCDEWRESVELFVDWATSNGYQSGLQIDKDLLGDGLLYSPDTCCWLTPKENSQYKRNSQYCLLNGNKMNDSTASVQLGHDPNYISKIRCGAARNKYPNLVLLTRCCVVE